MGQECGSKRSLLLVPRHLLSVHVILKERMRLKNLGHICRDYNCQRLGVAKPM